MAQVAQHRAGSFKQSNKKHKTGRHRTKGTLDEANKGRKDGIKSLTKVTKRSLSKKDRRNQAKQLRGVKRARALEEKRQLGDSTNPPFLTAVISLCADSSSEALLRLLSTCDSDAVTHRSDSNVTHISVGQDWVSCGLLWWFDLEALRLAGLFGTGVPRFKCRFSFVTPDSAKIYDILDTLKVCDSVAFLWPHDAVLTKDSRLVLDCILAQGLPTPLNVVQGISTLSSKHKEQSKRDILKAIEKHSMADGKLLTADSESDGLMILRQISESKRRVLSLQKHRARLLVESCETVTEAENTLLAVTGYIRGHALDVHSLVHLPGWGDFQLDRIELVPDPNPLIIRKNRGTDMEDDQIRLLEKADPSKRETLDTEVVPDVMDGEQTWPTRDELEQAEIHETTKKEKRVPKGTSEYQASWIVEESDGEQEDSDPDLSDESADEMELSEASDDDDESEGGDDLDKDEIETSTVTSQMDSADMATVDFEEVEKYRKDRENVQFPDEIDTPFDQPSRVRFQKYRGLKSFRTSPWDPKENLPSDYARIFQFQNYKRTRKRVFNREENGALHGWYVRIYICGLDKETSDQISVSPPLIVYGLLPHEQRITLVNFVLRKHPSCTTSIKSKEELIFHVGFRRFVAKPIFSQHTNSDKHKMERYMPSSDSGAFVASVYAPITYPPASCLVFKADSNGAQRLVATGALQDMNPDRVVVKRIVLSGHPYKIHKRSAVVRYLFFNRDDILWFKPVELRTKDGHRGHIKEPIGTHGHVKCTFDNQLTSQDTVLMNLFKRVYPTWSYSDRVPAPTHVLTASTIASSAAGDHCMMDDAL